nr:HNH endonuclease [Hafnia psychrotolerans]
MDVKLCREGKQYIFLSHRVVAMTFIPNPDSLPVIDHINGCRSDNRISNLEWVTTLENNRRLWRAGHGNNPRAEKAKRFRCPIKATNHDTGETLILRGTAEIRAAGFNSHNVTSCLQGNRNTCKGFSFVRLE